MSSRDLNLAIPILRDAAPEIIAEYDANPPVKGATLFVVCVSRLQEEQFEAYKQGRTFVLVSDGSPVKDPMPAQWVAGDLRIVKTYKPATVTSLDGYKKFSKHIIREGQPLSHAIDFGVILHGKYAAGPKDIYLYAPLSELAHKRGLIHGGVDFPRFEDWPHIEDEGPFHVPTPVTI